MGIPLPIPFIITNRLNKKKEPVKYDRWGDRIDGKKKWDAERITAWVFVGFMICIVASMPIVGIASMVDTYKTQDRQCTSEYGPRWDHQNRNIPQTDGSTTYRLVCINIDTKEERPVPAAKAVQ